METGFAFSFVFRESAVGGKSAAASISYITPEQIAERKDFTIKRFRVVPLKTQGFVYTNRALRGCSASI